MTRKPPAIIDAGPIIDMSGHTGRAKMAIEVLQRKYDRLITNEAVIGQVWRGTGDHAIASFLQAVTVEPLTDGKAIGRLCGAAGLRDITDASLIVMAMRHGGVVITNDFKDLQLLAGAAGNVVEVIDASA